MLIQHQGIVSLYKSRNQNIKLRLRSDFITVWEDQISLKDLVNILQVLKKEGKTPTEKEIRMRLESRVNPQFLAHFRKRNTTLSFLGIPNAEWNRLLLLAKNGGCFIETNPIRVYPPSGKF